MINEARGKIKQTFVLFFRDEKGMTVFPAKRFFAVEYTKDRDGMDDQVVGAGDGEKRRVSGALSKAETGPWWAA
ncbi:MAG TPA: hypothetical protein PK379_01350 [Candidatus Hydrogenedentes bacterium]|nr:hypothetical protein [Candidatus Hydrogenedentota bacterium]HOJ69337.1 hypothetical protein [Candidatus Hydrogenedentota bacterium]HOK88648.1 hypothetical protein [Candidatus Hydrogenedentota bacterium]